jgi:protein disulfide-isomerase A6
MKPAWDKLGLEFKESESVTIADVDCTVYRDICDKYGVRGFPTIKYFTAATAATGDSYDGGRDFAALHKFALESLGPACSDAFFDLCDEEQKAVITKYRKMTKKEREAIVAEADAAVKAAEENFEKEVKVLQDTYDQTTKDKDAAIKAIQTPELRLLKTYSD